MIDMDHKYDGLIHVQLSDFVLADSLMTSRYEARFPGVLLTCDAAGLPTTWAGRRRRECSYPPQHLRDGRASRPGGYLQPTSVRIFRRAASYAATAVL